MYRLPPQLVVVRVHRYCSSTEHIPAFYSESRIVFSHFAILGYATWINIPAILHDFLAVLQGALKPKDRPYIIRVKKLIVE